MRPCMFCREAGNYALFERYEGFNNSAKDDMVEFLGDMVEAYLNRDSGVCYGCRKALDCAAKLKKRIWRFISLGISTNYANVEPMYLEHIGNVLGSISLDDDLEVEALTGTGTQYNMSPDLMTPSYSTPYNEELERKFEKREYSRSVRGTKRKFLTPSSEFRMNEPRSKSSMSHKRNVVNKSRLRSGLTRSVSKLEYIEAEEERSVFYCGESNCPWYFYDIKMLDFHKVKHHKYRYLYFCDECNIKDIEDDDEVDSEDDVEDLVVSYKYTEKQHLEIHIAEAHDKTSVFCCMCLKEFKDRFKLRDHWDKHMKSSVSCVYCVRSFLTTDEYRDHAKICMKANRGVVRIKPRRIIRDQIFKDDEAVSLVDNWEYAPKSEYSRVNLARTIAKRTLNHSPTV